MLSAGLMADEVAEALMDFRENHGGTLSGMTRCVCVCVSCVLCVCVMARDRGGEGVGVVVGGVK